MKLATASMPTSAIEVIVIVRLWVQFSSFSSVTFSFTVNPSIRSWRPGDAQSRPVWPTHPVACGPVRTTCGPDPGPSMDHLWTTWSSLDHSWTSDLGRACESDRGAPNGKAVCGRCGRCGGQESGADGKDGSGRKHGCGFHVYL